MVTWAVVEVMLSGIPSPISSHLKVDGLSGTPVYATVPILTNEMANVFGSVQLTVCGDPRWASEMLAPERPVMLTASVVSALSVCR
jgi:hypothetical protein